MSGLWWVPVAFSAACWALLALSLWGTSRVAGVLLVVAVALLPLNGIRRGGVTASDVAAAGAVLLAVLDPTFTRRRLVLPGRFLAGMWVFVLAGLAGTATAAGAGAGNFARLLVAMVAAVVGAALWTPSLPTVRRLAWAWLAGAAVNVAVALAQAQQSERRPAGLTTHPNALGLTCALAVAFAVFVAANGSRRGRLVAVGAGGLALVGVVASGSRAAAVAVVAALLVRAFVGTSGPTKSAAVLGLVGGALLLDPLTARLPEDSALNRLVHSTGNADLSDADRRVKLADTLAAIRDHPWVGSGFADSGNGHDLALQVAASAGLIGLAGFAVACTPMVAALWARSQWRWLALPAFTFFVAALFSNNLWDRYVWFCLGLGMLAYINTREPVTTGRTTARSVTPSRT